jgi:hypothetical protein
MRGRAHETESIGADCRHSLRSVPQGGRTTNSKPQTVYSRAITSRRQVTASGSRVQI